MWWVPGMPLNLAGRRKERSVCQRVCLSWQQNHSPGPQCGQGQDVPALGLESFVGMEFVQYALQLTAVTSWDVADDKQD